MSTLTKPKNEMKTQVRNQELEIINESDLPGTARSSQYDHYIEKFKTISKGQAVVLDVWDTNTLSGVRQLLKTRYVGDFSIKVRKEKAYLIKK